MFRIQYRRFGRTKGEKPMDQAELLREKERKGEREREIARSKGHICLRQEACLDNNSIISAIPPRYCISGPVLIF